MTKNSWKLCLPALLFLASCEKAINFTPVEQSVKLVVEATIENERYPVVYLTTSLDFFSKISIDALAKTFVKGADVSVSNGTVTMKLAEHTTQVEGYELTYYTVDSSDLVHAFKGKLGEAYSLQINEGGKEYTSNTTIPLLAKEIKSLYYESNVDKKDSSKVSLFATFDDPPGFGNYIRYFTSTNGGPFYPGLNSVYDDQVIDGKNYSVQVERGVDRNSNIDFENYSFFHHGDTIAVKLCNIDRATYDFWKTMEYSYSSIGNPFSSPTKVTGNISNSALGYFGGYAVQYSNIIIPE